MNAIRPPSAALDDFDDVLRELYDRTNQTWAHKRARWAAFVRVQEAEIRRLRTVCRLAEEQIRLASMKGADRDRIRILGEVREMLDREI